MPDKKQKKLVLSASRIKTYQSCSWKFYCEYKANEGLGLPKEGNDGMRRGNVCHNVLELILAKNRRDIAELIVRKNSISAYKPVHALVKKYLEKEGALSQENYDLCNSMIIVALKNDFFGKGGRPDKPEREFTIENKNPYYVIRGFLDKVIKYTKDKKIKIVDYKTSKSKFKGDDLTSNIQAMAYVLASKKQLYKSYKDVLVEFLFLKFGKSPSEQVSFTDEEIEGFEYHLADIYKKIDEFDENAAVSNFAYHKPYPKDGSFGGPVSCGYAKYKGELKVDGTIKWHCDFKFPYDYYAIIDEQGKVLKTSLKKEALSPKANQSIEKKHYEGCPVHNPFSEEDFPSCGESKKKSLEEQSEEDFNF